MKEWFNQRNAKCFGSSYRKKRRYKKIEKRNDETNENDYTEDLGSTEEENEDGQSSNTRHDQDSDISFKNDADEEIDTTAIVEEEWIECVKKKHRRSQWKDEECEESMLDQNSLKNEMEAGEEKRIATGRKMDSESCWMEPWTQFKIQDLQNNR